VDFDVAKFLTWYVALIVAMVAHEGAHAAVAYLGGDRTAYDAGQVTLNPIPHMQREPFGMIVLPILTFIMMGWPLAFAHAPYSIEWARRHPKRAAVMAAAGPAANLLLVVVMFGFIKLGLAQDWFEPAWQLQPENLVYARDLAQSGIYHAMARIASVLLSINLLLGVFNLLPVPPLDGAGIAEGLLPGPLGNLFRLLRSSPMFAIGGIIVAFMFAGQILGPAFRLVYTLING